MAIQRWWWWWVAQRLHWSLPYVSINRRSRLIGPSWTSSIQLSSAQLAVVPKPKLTGLAVEELEMNHCATKACMFADTLVLVDCAIWNRKPVLLSFHVPGWGRACFLDIASLITIHKSYLISRPYCPRFQQFQHHDELHKTTKTRCSGLIN